MLEDMSALPALDWLDLSDNELTGPLPAFPLAVRCALLLLVLACTMHMVASRAVTAVGACIVTHG
jgi:hypothetical protein